MSEPQQYTVNQSPLLARYVSYYRGQKVVVGYRDHTLVLQLSDAPKQQWQWNPDSGCLTGNDNADYAGLLCALEYLFGQIPTLQRIALILDPQLQSSLLENGLARFSETGELFVTAQLFWQLNDLWISHGGAHYPQNLVMSDEGRRHPQRPAKRSGIVYRRFIPWLEQTLSFRTVVVEEDLNLFHRWMHHPRVEAFWQQADSLEELRRYLQMLEQDAHCQTLLGCFDDTPFAYFEIYWCKEDRIAPYYDAENFDRGLHLLVGEDSFRGKVWFTAWFPSLLHYIFLDDSRTQRILGEPSYDNSRLIRNFQRNGFGLIKKFDFPHKRAQLIMLLRESFFQGNCLHPYASDDNRYLNI